MKYPILGIPPHIKFSDPLTRGKFLFFLWKSYYQTGYDLLNSLMIKYLIILFGFSTSNVTITLMLGVLFVILCFIVGWLWYYFKMIEAEKEFGNVYNPFVWEMREAIKKNGN